MVDSERKPSAKYLIGIASESSKTEDIINPGKAGSVGREQPTPSSIMTTIDNLRIRIARDKGDGRIDMGSVMSFPVGEPVDLSEGDFAIIFNHSEHRISTTLFVPEDNAIESN